MSGAVGGQKQRTREKEIESSLFLSLRDPAATVHAAFIIQMLQQDIELILLQTKTLRERVITGWPCCRPSRVYNNMELPVSSHSIGLLSQQSDINYIWCSDSHSRLA